MDTVYSLRHARPPVGDVVFDFVLGPRGAGWWRHDFEADGRYAAVGPVRLADVRDELAATPATYVIELRSAAVALEAAVGTLLDGAEAAAVAGEPGAADRLADRAADIEHHRLRVLDEMVRTCDAAWDHAIERVERARGREPDELSAAIRTVELLWTARQAVRRMLGAQRPA